MDITIATSNHSKDVPRKTDYADSVPTLYYLSSSILLISNNIVQMLMHNTTLDASL